MLAMRWLFEVFLSRVPAAWVRNRATVIGHIHLVKLTVWNVFSPISFLLCLTRRRGKPNWAPQKSVTQSSSNRLLFVRERATPFFQTLSARR